MHYFRRYKTKSQQINDENESALQQQNNAARANPPSYEGVEYIYTDDPIEIREFEKWIWVHERVRAGKTVPSFWEDPGNPIFIAMFLICLLPCNSVIVFQ